MYDTIIVSGGSLQTEFALRFLEEEKINAAGRGETLRLIAADRGLEFFRQIGQIPDLIVGDFDSLPEEGQNYLSLLEKTEKTKVVRLNVEKDDSDTQSAVNLAIDLGARSIAILGATGTRLDHVFANIGLLQQGKERGAQITLVDPYNCVSLVESGTVLKRDTQFGDFISFFPLNGTVYGLTLEGFRYPLRDHDLYTSDSGLTVSNEIKEKEAKITFKSGTLLMIMSRDK